MKLKTQIKIYQRLLSELGRKYGGAEDFISSRVKEYVCIYFLCYIYSLVTTTVKNEFFCIKIVLFLRCRTYKKQIFLLRCIKAE